MISFHLVHIKDLTNLTGTKSSKTKHISPKQRSTISSLSQDSAAESISTQSKIQTNLDDTSTTKRKPYRNRNHKLLNRSSSRSNSSSSQSNRSSSKDKTRSRSRSQSGSESKTYKKNNSRSSSKSQKQNKTHKKMRALDIDKSNTITKISLEEENFTEFDIKIKEIKSITNINHQKIFPLMPNFQNENNCKISLEKENLTESESGIKEIKFITNINDKITHQKISPLIPNFQNENNRNPFIQLGLFQNNSQHMHNFPIQPNQIIFNNINKNSSNDIAIKVRPELQMSYKHARRIYVGNMPDEIIESRLKEFIYKALEIAGGCIEPGNPVN